MAQVAVLAVRCVVDLAVLAELAVLAVAAAWSWRAGGPGGSLAVLAQRAVLALPEVVVALAAEEEPEALVDLLSRQSFSAAMARTTP